MNFKLIVFLIIVFFGIYAIPACRMSKKHKKKFKQVNSTILFNEQNQVVEYANGFDISHNNNFNLLEIINPYPVKNDTIRYILKPRDNELNELNEDARIVEVPVKNVIITSTTHVGFFNFLQSDSVISGVASAEYVFDQEVREKINENKILSFPNEEINLELVLKLNPDVIFVSSGPLVDMDKYRVLIDAGIEVIFISEWIENSPLGKAEWVKVFGALLNKESLANSKFQQITQNYKKLLTKVNGVSNKPQIINGIPYKGTWYIAGGQSYEAELYRDAGANYDWIDQSSRGALQMDFEAIYEVGLQADIWVNPGTIKSMTELLTLDKRFEDFKSYQSHQIFNNTKRITSSGGNDYWESGVVRPDRILADLIHIFHPKELPEHKLYYYKKLD